MIAYFVREIRPAANLNFDTKMAQLVLDFRSIPREFKHGSNDYAGPTPMGNLPLSAHKHSRRSGFLMCQIAWALLRQQQPF
jgi:hypothetical protein